MVISTNQEVINILRSTGAVLDGHFLLTSGKHSEGYVQCALLLQYPDIAEKLCSQLAQQIEKFNPQIVIGPAMGGILVAYEVARSLGTSAIFTERKNGEMQLRRGFKITPGQRVLVVEDVVTTGGSVGEVLEVVKALGAEVVAVASLIDRSEGRVDFGVPFQSLISLHIPTYDQQECPSCKKGSKAIKPGSR